MGAETATQGASSVGFERSPTTSTLERSMHSTPAQVFMPRFEGLVAEFATIPLVAGGSFLDAADEGSAAKFELTLSVKKLVNGCASKSSYTWLPCAPHELFESSPDVKFKSRLSKGHTLVVGKIEGSADGGKPRRVLELRSQGHIVTTLDVSSLHGDFCTDDTLGLLSWSPDGRYFLYHAEELLADATSFSKFRHVESFGEKLQDFKNTCLVRLDLQERRAEKLKLKFSLTEEAQPQQATFLDSQRIVFTGLRTGSRKLGQTFIYCRPTAIFIAEPLGDSYACKCVSDWSMSSRSPIVSECGARIAYLQNSVGGSHFKASRLMMHNVSDCSTRTVIDIVDEPNGCEFPGLFVQRLPLQRFTDKIFLVSAFYDQKAFWEIDLLECRAQPAKGTESFGSGSWRVLDWSSSKSQFLLLNVSSSCPGVVCVFDAEKGIVGQFPLAVVDNHPRVREMKATLRCETVTVSPTCNVLLLTTAQLLGSRQPLILLLHGGPNSIYANEFVLYAPALVAAGYSVASVNYTGSIGFGDASIRQLEGGIGERDVQDCHAALLKIMDVHDFDRSRLFVMGGSHGGFLTAHLSAKYPELFAGAIMRNPVIDLPSMMVTSDITDWVLGQLGLDFDQLAQRMYTAEEMQLLRARSPSAFAAQVRCRTLLLLGALDLRVPPSQGLLWANLLRSNGVSCATYMYPDANHGLETPNSELFGLVAILDFLAG